MSGMAGNKGAVAIRLDYANTRLCFVTAHLAAGFANYEERNRDYRTISHGLRFQRNHPIDDHDTIIWLGDFNYRIGLSEGKVRQYIDAADLDTLYQNDQVIGPEKRPRRLANRIAGQLNLQMVAGQTFPYYSEARITFMPYVQRLWHSQITKRKQNLQIRQRNRQLRHLVCTIVVALTAC